MMAKTVMLKATRCVAVVCRVKPQRGQAPGLAKMVAPHPMHLVVFMTYPRMADASSFVYST